MSVKRNELKAKWSKKENSIMYHYGKSASDGRILSNGFEDKRMIETFDGVQLLPSFAEELEARGFDLSTLKFSIKLKEGL